MSPKREDVNVFRFTCALEIMSVFLCLCSCRLNDEAKSLISNLGSSVINALGFRDNWIFVGGKGIRTKSPFEQVIPPAEPMFTFVPLGFLHWIKAAGLPFLKKVFYVRKCPTCCFKSLIIFNQFYKFKH